MTFAVKRSVLSWPSFTSSTSPTDRTRSFFSAMASRVAAETSLRSSSSDDLLFVAGLDEILRGALPGR